MRFVYKIMGADEWAAAMRTGTAPPAEIDRRDGYIHLSSEDQVLETARIHFAGRKNLIAAAFDSADFGDALKWEASRGGALFPHLYDNLPAGRAVRVVRLEIDSAGGVKFGEDVK